MQHTLGLNFSGSGEVITSSTARTGTSAVMIDETIAAAVSDDAVVCPIDVSALKTLFMVSDIDCTVETNDGAAPDDTIALKAGVPLVWDSTSAYFANPLTADVTVIYVTAAAQVRIRVFALLDATP